MLLGATGLLKGHRATSHWNVRDLLPLVGAIPVDQRVVEDRNPITAGGVTLGIDFGLVIVSRMRDERFAQLQQLLNEYDPHPPFNAGTPRHTQAHPGTPRLAGPELTANIRKMLAPGREATRQAALEAQKRLALV